MIIEKQNLKYLLDKLTIIVDATTDNEIKDHRVELHQLMRSIDIRLMENELKYGDSKK